MCTFLNSKILMICATFISLFSNPLFAKNENLSANHCISVSTEIVSWDKTKKTYSFKNNCDKKIQLAWCVKGDKKACGTNEEKYYTSMNFYGPGESVSNYYSMNAEYDYEFAACFHETGMGLTKYSSTPSFFCSEASLLENLTMTCSDLAKCLKDEVDREYQLRITCKAEPVDVTIRRVKNVIKVKSPNAEMTINSGMDFRDSINHASFCGEEKTESSVISKITENLRWFVQRVGTLSAAKHFIECLKRDVKATMDDSEAEKAAEACWADLEVNYEIKKKAEIFRRLKRSAVGGGERG